MQFEMSLLPPMLTKYPYSLMSFLSSSASVFGVSAKSMQCSFDDRGNSVPTILLMMQNRLYSEGGLRVCIDIYYNLAC